MLTLKPRIARPGAVHRGGRAVCGGVAVVVVARPRNCTAAPTADRVFTSPCHLCRSSNRKQPETQAPADAGLLTSLVPGSSLYTAVEVVELLAVLALIDAAYSGDWSRIGAISKDTELVLQKLVAIVAVGHTITGAAAGWLAQQEGRPWLVPALKGVAFGAMGLYEETSRKN